MQRRVTVPCTQKAFVPSATSLDMPKGNKLWKLSVSVETLVAGLSMHQGHGLKAINKAQTWHCSMQHAGDEDSQTTSLICKIRKYLAVSAQLNRAI